MHTTTRFALTLALLTALVMTGTGCRPKSPASTQAPDPPTTTPAATISTPAPTSAADTNAPTPAAKSVQTRAYFVRGEMITVAGRTANSAAVASEAMKALLAGPTPAEKSAGIGTQIPAGTKLLGVVVSGGTATVNLSKRFESGGGSLSMTLRVAQVVSTLTQFPSVQSVAFKLDGVLTDSIGGEGLIVSPPVSRADYESVMPAILVEAPIPGQAVGRPMGVFGTANVFEAQFRVQVRDRTGKVIADTPVTASSGTGTRGTFRARISYPGGHAGPGTIRFFEPSAKDGTPTNVVNVPVTLR